MHNFEMHDKQIFINENWNSPILHFILISFVFFVNNFYLKMENIYRIVLIFMYHKTYRNLRIFI